MLLLDVHVWTNCRNISVVKLLTVLARAGGGGRLRLTRQDLGTDMSCGVGRRAGWGEGFNPNPPTTDTLVSCHILLNCECSRTKKADFLVQVGRNTPPGECMNISIRNVRQHNQQMADHIQLQLTHDNKKAQKHLLTKNIIF